MERKCKDICPLPKGCADNIEKVNQFASLRKKNVSLGGKNIGYTSVLISQIEDQGFGRRDVIMGEVDYSEMVKNGIKVDKNAVACSSMTELYNYVLKRKGRGGASGGTINCCFTSKVRYGSGISKP